MRYVYRIMHCVFLCMGLVSFSVNAQDVNYPNKPITIIVPWPAGGAADFMARTIGPALSKRLGKPVIVENKPGAATNLGTQLVAEAAPDGYTLLMASSNNCVNVTLLPPTKVDFVKDFKPITNVGLAPNILVINPDVPVRNVSELIALAKAKPGVLNYGSSGNGSAAHLGAEKFKSMAGVDIVGIQYKGAAPAIIDLVGGHLSMMFTVIPAAKSQVDSGRLRLLAVATTERLPLFPNAPTVSESGLKGFESGLWYGLVAPSNTPDSVINLLNKEVTAVLKDPAIVKQFNGAGVFPIGDSSAAFSQTIKSDIAKYAELIRAANIKAD